MVGVGGTGGGGGGGIGVAVGGGGGKPIEPIVIGKGGGIGGMPGRPGIMGGIPGIGGGNGSRPGVSENIWFGRSFGKRGFCAANMRSAAVPCLSPLASFLKAYETEIARLHKNCPFIASMAISDASNDAKFMNANPLLFPVSGSRIILGT